MNEQNKSQPSGQIRLGRLADKKAASSFEESDLPFPRRCDRITRQAHGRLIYVVTIAFAVFFIWTAFTQLDQVVRGGGRVVPQLQNQIVQHLEGGIIKEILVREGDRVQKGQTLMRIENSFSNAELSQTRLEIQAVQARITRLEAEISGRNSLTFSSQLREIVPDIVRREDALFRSRMDTLASKLAILDDQERQQELELSELRSRWANIQKERELVSKKVASLRKLLERGAISTNEMLENEQVLQQIETRISDLSHDIPRTQAALSEARERRAEAILKSRAAAEEDLSSAELELAKLNEQVAALQDRSARSDMVAPIDGVVNKLFLATIGGVVRSGEPLVQLVPTESAVAVEVQLSPSDRADVWPGLPAVVKISAYDYSIFGGLKGKIIDISPDIFTNEEGEPYFRVRLEAEAGGFGPDKPVVPGMLANVDILTGRQSILSYLLKPVRHLRDNALRQ
jgi:adhesin transport system membrane fusion protein